MDIKLPSENPIVIINPGNGEPGIAPCFAVAQTSDGEGAGPGGGNGGLPGICDCWFIHGR